MKAGNKANAINSLSQQKHKTSGQIDTSLVLKDQYVDQKINNMRINDQVKFSTITLSFYQHSTITKTAVANDNLSDYGPGFLKRAGFNFTAGWVIFMEFILILINLWMFLLAAVVVYFSLAYYRRHRASLK